MASGYIDITDISSRMKNWTFSASSNPTTVEVESFIDEVETEVDARLNAAGVIVPVTNTDKVKVVGRIVTNGVIAEILRSVNIEDEDAAGYQERYESGLRAIEKNPAIIEETATVEQTIGGYVSDARRYKRNERVW